MHIKDETARRSLELTRQAVRDNSYGEPFLGLDVEAYRAYREGKSSALPKPYCDDPVDAMMMASVQEKHVLCLAGGGGQQSVVFSLLGANVTVLDLTPEQLERDQEAARHYGYEVTTVQGDMRDLSALRTGGFDRVYQPISTLYVPDLSEIYREVARVLKPGGLYSADYAVPLLYMAEDRGWDGTGYVLRVSQPYARGAILETEEGKLNFAEGESFAEFHHLLSDILNGLIAEGFAIRSVWENPRPGTGKQLEDLEPGSEHHRDRFLPFGLSVVAEGTGPKERGRDT
jgi:ubiquinone/menaquinone biosynthesis C-methylase UbiE